MEYVEQYLEKLITSIKGTHEQYTYGEDLEKQIDEVIKMYREEGYNTNQAYMAVGNASSILLEDPQCLRGMIRASVTGSSISCSISVPGTYGRGFRLTLPVFNS